VKFFHSHARILFLRVKRSYWLKAFCVKKDPYVGESIAWLADLAMLAVDPAHQGKCLGRHDGSICRELLRQQRRKGMDLSVLSLRPELLRSIVSWAMSKTAPRKSTLRVR